MARQVILYSQPGCPFCDRIKEYLAQKGVSYSERDVAQDMNALNELRTMGIRSVPVTVVDGQTVVGFDREKLDQLLAKS